MSTLLNYFWKHLGGTKGLFDTPPVPTLDFSASEQLVFHLLLIKPTRYDDDGYPIQWREALIPSNSLACMYGIALDTAKRNILGNNIEIRVSAFDELETQLDYRQLLNSIRQSGQRVLLCLIGVQTNQFPRSVDIAQTFIEAGVPVCIGGFHVSGIVSMLDGLTPELIEAQQTGISLYAGEAEMGRFDQVVIDAWNGALKPLYNHVTEMIEFENQPFPVVVREAEEENYRRTMTMDLGRGCPYQCSFCCIINVQGNKSRSRSPQEFEQQIRAHWQKKITQFFITDDDFARNKNWESYLDKLIELREEGIKLDLIIQVDALCHKVPRFIEKAAKAGALHVFIGLENVNPDNLAAMNKHQNKITEYRKMLLEWKKYPVIIWGSYIIGLPHDTRESILKDMEIIKRELPIDILNITIYTPLPGSEDHKRMVQEGAWLDPDLNKYDLTHRVTHHPLMSDDEFDSVYDEAWGRFYTFEHMVTILKRMFALGSNKKYHTLEVLLMFGIHSRSYRILPYDVGLLRNVNRTGRRKNYPVEPFLRFHIKRYLKSARILTTIVYYSFRLHREMIRIFKDPNNSQYSDAAITPPSYEEFQMLELYNTRGGKKAVEKIEFRRRGKSSENSSNSLDQG